MSIAQALPDTAMAHAFSAAGYQEPWDEALAVAGAAWRQFPAAQDSGARRSHVIAALQPEKAWAVLSHFLPGARAQLIGQLLNLVATSLQTGARPNDAAPLALPGAAGQETSDTQGRSAPAPASPSPDAQSTDAGQPAGPGQGKLDAPGQPAGALSSNVAAQAAAAPGQNPFDAQDADAGGTLLPDQATPQAEPGRAPATTGSKPNPSTPAAPPQPSLRDLANKHAAATQATVALTVRLCALDQQFDGQTIGDLTPDQALTLARKNAVLLRFIVLLSAGVPKDQPIRKFITPDEADAVYARARRDVTTAAWPAFNDQTGIGIVGQKATGQRETLHG